MRNEVEASPFINTICDEIAKNELYTKFFDPKHLGNMTGKMPLMGVDFHETEAAYAKRLRLWKQAENEVLFDGWNVKDMKHWQIAVSRDGNTTIQIDFNTYTITTSEKEYKFPTIPENIDDFINDCKRIGVKLFWKQEIIDKFGEKRISSTKKVVEIHKILGQSLD